VAPPSKLGRPLVGTMSRKPVTTGVWFRKCLRLHDNLPLVAACKDSDCVVPFFILDPHFDRSRVGVQRYAFLLESLRDLDNTLSEKYNSRLLVLQGDPEKLLRQIFSGKGKLQFDNLFFEFDSEPYAVQRDMRIQGLADSHGVTCKSFSGHTILDMNVVKEQIGSGTLKRPTDMKSIQKVMINVLGSSGESIKVPADLPAPPKIPPLGKGKLPSRTDFKVPEIGELYTTKEDTEILQKFGAMRFAQFPGGETAALARLRKEVSSQVDYVCNFQKPKTMSTNRGNAGGQNVDWTKPSTTGLSPYLKFGCLSVRKLWHEVDACYKKKKGKHSKPPESLHGQLMFRDMFYVLSYTVNNWDKDINNDMCKPVQWDTKNIKFLAAWEKGQTGYPFIDALMRQLHQTGWMHHLGRHAVSCFLTRGDLYQHWVYGREVFDRLLLDADWAINNGNWLWLAGVAPFSMPFFRVYSPCPGKDAAVNAEQTGEFIKFFVPELAKMPSKYIYSPWEAPPDVQKQAGCIVGRDYPKPVVEHKKACQNNLTKFGQSLSEIRKRKASMPGTAPAAKRGRTK